MIEVTVNGQKHAFESGTTVAGLLDQLSLNTQAIAVEINHEISPRDKHGQTLIATGDVLEIVTLVGGG